MITVPHFQSESEEADWWFQNQDLLAAEFERVKPSLGPSRAVRMMAEARGISVEQFQQQLKDSRSAAPESESITKLPWSA